MFYNIALESVQVDGQTFTWEADIPLHRECHFISITENHLILRKVNEKPKTYHCAGSLDSE